MCVGHLVFNHVLYETQGFGNFCYGSTVASFREVQCDSKLLSGLPWLIIFKPERKKETNKQTNNNKKNSVELVRKRTILTERPPLVGEVGANFCG
jgi:hypothetical protein